MANPKTTEKKKIKLHPLDSKGKQIKDITVYPETSIDSVKDINTGRGLDDTLNDYETKEDLALVVEDINRRIDTAGTPSDWGVNDQLNPAYIWNKPNIPARATLKEVAYTGKFEDLDFTGADITRLPNQKDGKGVYVKKVKINEETGTTEKTPANANGEITVDLTGYAHKSNTEGLITNTGEIDTTKYAPKGTMVAGKDLSNPQSNIQPYYYSSISNDTTYTLKTIIDINPTSISNIAKANNSENAATLSFVAWPENPNLFVLYYKNGDKEAYYYNNQWIDTTKTPITEQLTFTIDITGTIYDELNFRKIVTSSPEGTTVGQKINGLIEKLPDLYADKSDTYTKADVDIKERDLNNSITSETSTARAAERELQTNINNVNETLGGKITDEETRAKNIEDDLRADITTLQNSKANASDLTSGLALKADKADTYTKTEVNTELDKKHPLIDASHKLSADLVDGLGSAAALDANNTANNIPLIGNDGKLPTDIIPFQEVTGQMIYGGTAIIESGVATATLSSHAKKHLDPDGTIGIGDTLVLLNIATSPTKGGYKDNESIYYIVNTAGEFAGNTYNTGDWILGTDSKWSSLETSDKVKDVRINGTSILGDAIANFNTQSAYHATDNKIATMAEVNVKANSDDVTTALATKADKSTTYTKTDIDTNFETKEDLTTNYYNKTTTDNLLNAKADADNVYSKTTIDTKVTDLQNSINNKVDKEITSVNGTAKILNEADGGGAMFEGASTKSYLGVHDGTGPQDATGKYLAGQIYAKDKIATDTSGSWKGAKLNLYTDGFYYTKNRGTGGETADQEIATKGDIAVKGIQKNGTDLTPDANGKVNITVPNVNVNDVQINETSIVDANGIANVPEQVNADWNANSGYAQILNKPPIPTKTIVQNWGFYEKPSAGIPETDLESNLQSKIDGAIQYSTGETQIEQLGFIKTVNAENLVLANPTVTDQSPTLNSISIHGINYKIEGGGGGGSYTAGAGITISANNVISVSNEVLNNIIGFEYIDTEGGNE